MYSHGQYRRRIIMLDCLKKIDKAKTGIFAAGVLFGTAAVLRAKECVLKTAACVQENAEDIYAGAKQINDDRAAMDEEFEDESFTEVEDEEETEA